MMSQADRIVFGSSLAPRLMHAEEFDPTKYNEETYLYQPKLNGVRAVWAPHAGFFSRMGIPYGDDLTAHIKIEGCPYILDGEFYAHGMRLQEINAAISHKLDSTREDTKRIEFHIFDLLSQDSRPLRNRLIMLEEFRTKGYYIGGCKLVEYRQANCMNHLRGGFNSYTAAGYEGLMLRNPDSLYTAGRTRNVLKWKAWQQDAYKCVGFKQGLGKYKDTLGAIIFALPNGKGEFACSGMTDAERHEIWANPDKYKDKIGLVKYLTLSRTGHPQNVTFQYWIQP